MAFESEERAKAYWDKKREAHDRSNGHLVRRVFRLRHFICRRT